MIVWGTSGRHVLNPTVCMRGKSVGRGVSLMLTGISCSVLQLLLPCFQSATSVIMNRQLVILFACGLLVFAAPLDNGDGNCVNDDDCHQNETCKIETGNKTGICVDKEIPKVPKGPSTSAIILYVLIAFLIVGVISLYAAYAVKQHNASSGGDGLSSERLQESEAGGSSSQPVPQPTHYEVPKILRDNVSVMPSDIDNEVVYSEIAPNREPIPEADEGE